MSGMMVPSAAILAFGFGNLAMLGWLGAAAAPWLIHLWNKRKYREMRWAAVEFLLAALRKNARRIQIQQWLLLAVRTLLIALVVLAMSEPFVEQLGLKFVPGARTHKVLVLDGSYSMGYRPSDSSLFARAKELAARIVDESPQGDGFTLVLMTSPPRMIVGTPAFAARDFIQEIDNLALPHAGGDLPGTVKLVQEILRRASEENSGLDQSEVYFITDLGRASWVPDFGQGSGAAEFRENIAALAQSASLVVLDLGQPGAENLAVSDVRMADPFATLWRDVTIEAQVHNFGAQATARQLVELTVDDTRVSQAYVDIEPGEEAAVSFTYRFEAPGYHVIGIKLPGDLLEIDNERWLSLPAKPSVRVLCIGGTPEASYYLTSALDPDRTDRSLVQPLVASESALTEMNLNQFDCVFLSNVAQFTPTEARLLQAYLKHGGGLVFFLGDRVLADRYNQELAGEEPQAPRLLPARLGKVVAEAQYRFDPLDYQHPIVRSFRGREDAGLLTTPVYKYFQLIKPKEWTRSRTALAFSGGDPAIVEEPLLGGHVILVAIPASLDSVDPVSHSPWTTMPAWPSFVPLVQEMVATAAGSQTSQSNSQVGQVLGGPVPVTAINTPLAITTPDGHKQAVRVQEVEDQPQWSFDATYQSGVYRLAARDAPPIAPDNGSTPGGASGRDSASAPSAAPVLGDPLVAPIPFAVNVDVAEGDLRKAAPDELPDGFVVKTDWQNLDQEPSAQIGRRTGLHKFLLYGALGLLLLESLLAWRIGRGTA